MKMQILEGKWVYLEQDIGAEINIHNNNTQSPPWSYSFEIYPGFIISLLS